MEEDVVGVVDPEVGLEVVVVIVVVVLGAKIRYNNKRGHEETFVVEFRKGNKTANIMQLMKLKT